MGVVFWVKRFLVVWLGAFVVIGLAQAVRGRGLSHAVIEGSIWATVSASVFTVARFYQARNGQHCALCKDTPELQPTGRDVHTL